MDQQILEENTALQDNAIALKIAVDSSASCRNFTHKDMLNPSSDYAYANNPGLYACSSELLKTALANSVTNSVISCNFIANQSSCPFYDPHYSVVLKSSLTLVNTTLNYYLSRFRSFDGSFYYKIYDSNGTIFFDLNYVNISNANGEIDEEAKKVFYQFLEECTQEDDYSVESILNDKPSEKEQNKNKSYLNSLIS